MALYDIIQDNEGYIWLTTESGVCKFDGLEFSQNLPGDLGATEIINIHKDSKGRIWLLDINRNLSFYEKGQLYELGYTASFSFLSEISEDKNGYYWFLNSKNKTENKINYVHQDSLLYKNAYQTITDTLFNYKNSLYALNDTINYIFHADKRIFTSIENYNNNCLSYHSFRYSEKDLLENTTLDLVNTNISIRSNKELLLSNNKELFLFSLEDHSLKLAFKEYGSHYKDGIRHVHKDQDENLWITTNNGILLLHYDASTCSYNKMSKHLEGIVTGIVMQDNQGQYWITTANDGLFFLSSLDIKVHQHEGFRQITCLAKDNNKIIYGTNNGNIGFLNQDTSTNTLLLPVKGISKKIYDIVPIKENKIFILSTNSLILYDYKNQFFTQLPPKYSFKAGVYKNDLLYIGTSSSPAFYSLEHNPYYETLENVDYNKKQKIGTLKYQRTYAVHPMQNNNVLYGTTIGLYEWDGYHFCQIDSTQLSYDIRSIATTPDHTYYLATQNKGLIIYKNGTIIKHLNKKYGLSSNYCKKILVDQDTLWLATNRGINKIVVDNDKQDYKTKHINTDNGLPNDDVNDLLLKGDTLVVATNDGLAYFHKNKIFEQKPPIININKITINNIYKSIQNSYQLKHYQNNIKIQFSGLTFKHDKDIKYQYGLLGLNDFHLSAPVNIAHYSSLPSGEYTFKVRAKTPNSDWSDFHIIQFNIKKPYWQEVWFYFLLTTFFSVLGYYLTGYIINVNKRRNAIETQIKESQLTALRSQMNPHFLHNALNSIQDFILREDKRSANRYLTKFSRLMRLILDMSAKEKVSLKEEIDALNLYLGIEAMRFEKNFDYQIIHNTNDFLLEKINIPPMLVQPYVENAIKHGLMHKKGFKQLYVHFIIKDSYIVCEIEDNGIGRTKSKLIKQRNKVLYSSKAMSLTAKRLRLLNLTNHQKTNVEVIDLIDAQGKARGTKIILKVAKLNN